MSSNFGRFENQYDVYKTRTVTAGSGGELVGICLSRVTHDRRMVEATVAIGAKCDGVRDLVGTSIGQHLHMVHFKKWRAVVGEKRRRIGAGFAEALGIGQDPSSDPRITSEAV